ncbi:NCDN [Bugula neritina]|uniref:NCDN n=1 Tax=Bugula neritina TaxID=10212 RepID=A0A7J7K545_BUGNE|nr:NCDN [Bugula neritina]
MANESVKNRDIETQKVLCLDLLKQARSDNEKLAGLLLVPKLFKSTNLPSTSIDCQAVDQQFQVDLLEAIDFQFLRRMLCSGDKISDSVISLLEEHVSLKIAASSVIACFTQKDVLSASQIGQLLPIMESILLTVGKGAEDTAVSTAPAEQCQLLLETTMQCLEGFCRDQDTGLLEESVVPVIYRLQLKQTTCGDLCNKLAQLISDIVKSRGSEWMSPNSIIATAAIYLHHIKVSELAQLDFSLCETCSRFLAVMLDQGVGVPAKLLPLVNAVMSQLCDSLKNKLPTLQRRQALNLLTSLIQLRGIKQLIAEKGSKAALLVIHLCSIEVRMTLEQDDNHKVVAESETLCASFFALEQMIFYMSHEETTLALDSKEILQVHSALQGAVGAIIYFLTTCTTPLGLDKSLYPVASACIRLLGAWTAEETESLLSKYIEVLPHLFIVCSQMLVELDSFKFLVPGLSNFTTDTEGIVEVVVNNLEFMCRYVEYCSTQICSGKEEYEHVLINTCVVVLNCLMMQGIKMTTDPTSSLFDTLATQTSTILEKCINLDCNLTMIAAALAALRKIHGLESVNSAAGETPEICCKIEKQQEAFCRQAVQYILNITNDDSTSKKKEKVSVRSSDIPEIWLMGVQVMGELMKKSELLKEILTEEEHIRTALKFFEAHSADVDVAFVLERLLLTMADEAGAKGIVTKVNKLKLKS